ncbi:uncharacterized protein LOC18443899 [Amborella trichopoda]|uniref:uncharacterized protein LOC18443899 n=1 Tax=Amborella trichopoda TaxID=13333 RepID=UPI0005D3A3BA|nr:uncharacterized protein LOC18443899 [Amborella trichopoda]|eukprot:XP_011626953.1 uncharacterized protein LOC18443899 [Amborella trichopoda]
MAASSPLQRSFTQICRSVIPLRRAIHTPVYDKNLDDHVLPSTVPDEVIAPESDKYWSPHPSTGVFSPIPKEVAATASSSSTSTPDSVLHQQAWFRPLEDVDNNHHLETPST